MLLPLSVLSKIRFSQRTLRGSLDRFNRFISSQPKAQGQQGTKPFGMHPHHIPWPALFKLALHPDPDPEAVLGCTFTSVNIGGLDDPRNLCRRRRAVRARQFWREAQRQTHDRTRLRNRAKLR